MNYICQRLWSSHPSRTAETYDLRVLYLDMPSEFVGSAEADEVLVVIQLCFVSQSLGYHLDNQSHTVTVVVTYVA